MLYGANPTITHIGASQAVIESVLAGTAGLTIEGGANGVVELAGFRVRF